MPWAAPTEYDASWTILRRELYNESSGKGHALEKKVAEVNEKLAHVRAIKTLEKEVKRLKNQKLRIQRGLAY